VSDERAVFIALPNGLHPDDDKLARVSIVVSPRLTADGDGQRLSDFNAFRNWPKTLDAVSIGLASPEGPELPEAKRDPSSRQPDPALWQAMFDENCIVRSRTFTDLTTRTLRSFPAANVIEHVEALYADIASSSATQFPTSADVADRIGPGIDEISSSNPELRARVFDETLTPAGNPQTSPRYVDRSGAAYQGMDGGKVSTFREAYGFYDRPGTRYKYVRKPGDPPVPGDAKPPPKPPELDFHACCTFLGDYPELLRQLGLVIDVLIPIEMLDEFPTDHIRVMIAPPGAPLDGRDGPAAADLVHPGGARVSDLRRGPAFRVGRLLPSHAELRA